MSDSPCSRRGFMRLCGSAAAAMSGASLAGALEPTRPVKLLWSDGSPVTAASLVPETEYLFSYPYYSTPCFLLRLHSSAAPVDLTTEEGLEYRWQGGVGPDRSVVAFSAICAHKLTHPSKAVSFIGYRREPVGFLNENKQVVRRAGVIQCCSEHSIYNPAAGARVISGPAAQPLAAVDLRARASGLEVVGVYGGQLFDRFFHQFGFRLEFELGKHKYREPVPGQTLVMRTDEYTRQRIQC